MASLTLPSTLNYTEKSSKGRRGMPPNRWKPTPGSVKESLADLADLGWRSFFLQQLDADEIQTSAIVRVTAVHRSGLHVLGVGLDTSIPHFAVDRGDETDFATVGDWLLLHLDTLRPKRLLQRISLVKRRAPGTGRRLQLIGARYRHALHRDLLQ